MSLTIKSLWFEWNEVSIYRVLGLGLVVIYSWSQIWINDIIFKLCRKIGAKKMTVLKLLAFFQKSRVFCCYELTQESYASTRSSCITHHESTQASMDRYKLLSQHNTKSINLHESTHNMYVSTHASYTKQDESTQASMGQCKLLLSAHCIIDCLAWVDT